VVLHVAAPQLRLLTQPDSDTRAPPAPPRRAGGAGADVHAESARSRHKAGTQQPQTVAASGLHYARIYSLLIAFTMKRARRSEASPAASALPPPPAHAEAALLTALAAQKEVLAAKDGALSALQTALAAQDVALAAKSEALAAKDEVLAAQKESIAVQARAAAAEARAAAAEAALASRDAAERDAARDAEAARQRRRIWQLEDEVTALTPRIDIIGLCVAAGFTEVGVRCAGLCRETWTTVPAGLSEANAARVRTGHPIWSRIINAKHGTFKETRLCWAARTGKLSRVRELCEWRAGIEKADTVGRTPLWVASSIGNRAGVRELLARGANIEAADNKGATNLYIASQNGHLAVVRELLARGANIEAAMNSGETILLVASQEGRLDIVRELLARGANVNAADNDGDTPLILASFCGHVDVVRALLAAGANKHHVANDGSIASSCAGDKDNAKPAAKAAVLALLAAAP
jgi:hypothetical protein